MFKDEEIEFYVRLPLLERSQHLVQKLFKDKLDKAGSNYMDHLLHVSQDFTDDKIKSIALMHDVLEDTWVTEQDLLKLGYDKSFVKVLNILTNTYDTYEEYIESVLNSKNEIALRIKLKDLLHNLDVTRLKKITKKDIKRSMKYLDAYIKVIEKLGGEEYDRY